METIKQYESPNIRLIEIGLCGMLLQTSNKEFFLLHSESPVEDALEGDTSTWGNWK